MSSPEHFSNIIHLDFNSGEVLPIQETDIFYNENSFEQLFEWGLSRIEPKSLFSLPITPEDRELLVEHLKFLKGPVALDRVSEKSEQLFQSIVRQQQNMTLLEKLSRRFNPNRSRESSVFEVHSQPDMDRSNTPANYGLVLDTTKPGDLEDQVVSVELQLLIPGKAFGADAASFIQTMIVFSRHLTDISDAQIHGVYSLHIGNFARSQADVQTEHVTFFKYTETFKIDTYDV